MEDHIKYKNKVDTFTSTGKKLLRHGDVLAKWNNGQATPIYLQVAPTEFCSLRCKFCSVVNRTKKHVFNINELIQATNAFYRLGTRAITISGGGDPLCYPKLCYYLDHLIIIGMKIGLITNGLGINRIIDKHLLNEISWIRISANVYDYKKKIEIPTGYKGTLGFSYCWTEGLSSIEVLKTIKQIAIDNNVEYIRLVPNCLATKEQQIKNNEFLAGVAEQVGAPVFFQKKEFEAPSACYWGYLNPFLYADGYVYPCSSTVLNPDADKQFNPIYRLTHWADAEEFFKGDIQSLVDTKRCEHCVFTEQNKMLEYALDTQKHEDFI